MKNIRLRQAHPSCAVLLLVVAAAVCASARAQEIPTFGKAAYDASAVPRLCPLDLGARHECERLHQHEYAAMNGGYFRVSLVAHAHEDKAFAQAVTIVASNEGGPSKRLLRIRIGLEDRDAQVEIEAGYEPILQLVQDSKVPGAVRAAVIDELGAVPEMRPADVETILNLGSADKSCVVRAACVGRGRDSPPAVQTARLVRALTDPCPEVARLGIEQLAPLFDLRSPATGKPFNPGIWLVGSADPAVSIRAKVRLVAQAVHNKYPALLTNDDLDLCNRESN